MAGVLESMLGIYDNRVLGLLVSTGVVDRLERPRTIDELASATGTDRDGLKRILRYGAARGFVGRRGDRYVATGISRALTEDPGSLRPWIEFLGSPWFWDAVRHLDTDLAVPPGVGMEAAAGHAFFDFVNEVDPQAGRAFNGAMASGSVIQGLGLVATLDWTDVRSVCDVGGGAGAVASALLRHLALSEVTVFDLPSVVGQIEPTDRLRPEAGSFFDRVPDGHDRYLLLAIVSTEFATLKEDRRR